MADNSGTGPAAVVLPCQCLNGVGQTDSGNAPDAGCGMPGEDGGAFKGFRRGLDPEPVLLPRLLFLPGGPVCVDAVTDPDKGAGLHTLDEIIGTQPVLDAVTSQ
jgi:hypothetical protein